MKLIIFFGIILCGIIGLGLLGLYACGAIRSIAENNDKYFDKEMK